MMRCVRHIGVLTALALSSACSVDLTCDEPQAYEYAREGKRIVAPDDLDQLEAGREQRIPEASPRDARPEGSPCLDLPPTVRGSSDSATVDE